MVIYSLTCILFCVSPSPLKIGQHPLYCALNVDMVALMGRQYLLGKCQSNYSIIRRHGQPREDALVTQELARELIA